MTSDLFLCYTLPIAQGRKPCLYIIRLQPARAFIPQPAREQYHILTFTTQKDNAVITLRPYQAEAVSKTLAALSSDRYALIHLATGMGKSIVVAEITKPFKRVVVCCPAMELVKQNHAKMQGSGLNITMIDSAHKGDWTADIVFTTPNTLYKNVNKIDEPDLLVLDEVHLGYLGKMRSEVLDLWKNCKVVGLTATPYYTERTTVYKDRAMWSCETIRRIEDDVFGEPVISLDYYDSLAMGYARDITIKKLDAIKIRDFHFGSTVFASLIAIHVSQIKNALSGMKNCIIYCDSKKHANELGERIPGLRVLFGTTSKKERLALINSFLDGEVKYIATVGTLQIGFDAPDLENIMVLTNYNSPNTTEQLIGRLNRGTCSKTCWHNGRLNTAKPVIGATTLTKIKDL